MCWIRGINFIDTARSYTGTCGDGTYVESEEMVGEVLSSRTLIPTEPIVIVTKGHGYELAPLAEDLAATGKGLAN